MTVLAAAMACYASADGWRARWSPLLLFGMIAAIAYRRETALLFCGALAMIVALGTGRGLPELALLIGVCTTAILQLGQVRSRDKLVYVGLAAGIVAFLLHIITECSTDQPLSIFMLDRGRAGLALGAVAAGFLMAGLLPFVETFFGVLTDLSLLELGDVAHPLLQELIRRAPATYNHSITVGSIGEAAAESIGARGLLVRVGAYFHDIGKMPRPEYFTENQGARGQPARSVLPTMSTLVIIAHIKDGVDLGRQRHLPNPIIDLIEQHHGTMLVEYFFGLAQEQKETIPTAARWTRPAIAIPARSRKPRKPAC